VAQKVQVQLIDDLDSSDADGTVRFGLDGAEYEIDLSAGHAEELRGALARYVGAARRAGGGGRRPTRAGRRAPVSALDPTEVREWAKAQGIEVKDRGRVSAELVARFKAATGKLGPEHCRLTRARRSHSHTYYVRFEQVASGSVHDLCLTSEECLLPCPPSRA
jgi:hypothetical protein